MALRALNGFYENQFLSEGRRIGDSQDTPSIYGIKQEKNPVVSCYLVKKYVTWLNAYVFIRVFPERGRTAGRC